MPQKSIKINRKDTTPGVSGKRVAMYLENAQELAAVLNMFADEAEKQIGHPL